MINRNQTSIRAILLAAAAVCLSATSHAAPLYWQVTTANIDTTDWNNSTPFNTAANGSGVSGGAYSALNVYHVESGKGIRTPNGSSTFSGAGVNAPLFLDGGWLRVRGTQTVANLTASTSSRIYAQDGTGQILNITNFNNSSGTTNLEANAGVGAMVVTYATGTLTGSGNFALNTTASDPLAKTIKFSATTASAWTGNLTWADTDSLTLDFDSSTIFGGGLIAPTTARITLDQNLTFAAVTLGATSLTAGVYSYTYLNTNFDAIFNNGGSGSITVVPEPATAVMLGMGAIVTLFGYRSRRRA